MKLVNFDLCGHMMIIFVSDARDIVIFIDDFSRKVWVYTLKSKREYLENLKEVKVLVEM